MKTGCQIIPTTEAYNLFIDPPENVNLKLTRSGRSATIACTAEARPKPNFKIFFNCDMLVKSDKTCTMSEVNSSNIGLYKCAAENILGERSSISIYLSLGKIKDPVRVCKYFIIFCNMTFYIVFFIDSTVFHSIISTTDDIISIKYNSN